MNLLIRCELTAPPSEVGAFRSMTLYATIFRSYDCLIVADRNEIDFYYKWLKNRGAYDFVKQFVLPNSETGKVLNIDRLTYNNLSETILYLG